MTAQRRRSMGSDAGVTRASVIATLVGVMIAAAVVALLIVVFQDNGASKGNNKQVAAAATMSKSAATPSAAITTIAGSTVPTTAATTATPTPTPTTAPSTSAKPTQTAKPKPKPKTTAAPKSAAPRAPLTYTVKRGDNLFNIAKWFHQHGYGALYERNKAVIGDDPNLIFPGQKITISSAGMSVSG